MDLLYSYQASAYFVTWKSTYWSLADQFKAGFIGRATLGDSSLAKSHLYNSLHVSPSFKSPASEWERLDDKPSVHSFLSRARDHLKRQSDDFTRCQIQPRQKSKWPSLKQRDAGFIATWVCSSNIKVKLEQIDFEPGKKNLIVSIVMGKMFRSLHLFGRKVQGNRELRGSLWCTRPGFESNFRVTVFGEKGRNKYEWETIKLSSCP